MLVSPWQKVIFDVRVKHVGHFPCLSLLTPWCPGQAVFLPPGYTGRRAGGGQMINLGQMTTSSSKHGRVGQHQWPREQGSPSIQQGLAGFEKHDPTKKPPLLCNIHQKIHHRGTALFYPTHDVFTIHTFTQQQGHRSIGLFKMVKCVKKENLGRPMKLVPLSVSLPPHVKSAAQPRSALSVWRLQARPPIGRNRPITARPGRQLGCDTRVGGLRGWAGCVLWSASDQLLVTNQLSGIRVCHSRVVGIQILLFPFLAVEPQSTLGKILQKFVLKMMQRQQW